MTDIPTKTNELLVTLSNCLEDFMDGKITRKQASQINKNANKAINEIGKEIKEMKKSK